LPDPSSGLRNASPNPDCEICEAEISTKLLLVEPIVDLGEAKSPENGIGKIKNFNSFHH
jgi:hypothetical protein